MANKECREADCAHWLGRNLGCEYTDLDGSASTLATARNISVARIITSRRSSMSKEQATEKWVVEVRRAHALEHRPGNWCCVAQCDDGQTAITVADALQNFMRTGLIGDDFHTRTRLVGEKGA